jgi:epoxyqueuosine reductase
MELRFENGEKFQIVRASLLEELEKEIRAFQSAEPLNNFQEWIVNDLYNFTLPESGFPLESILLIAIPHPLYSEVTFQHSHKQYHCISLVSSDFEGARNAVKRESARMGFRALEAKNLPLKRLAVQSGFSIYGRNNITYIDGLGSHFSYLAFYTDIPPAVSALVPVGVSASCRNCRACIRNCPTGAIRQDIFLIDNEKCLSCLNESADPFPDWVPAAAHHSLYDCIKCQIVCPMNKNHRDNKGKHVHFTEEETEIMLAGTSFGDYPARLKEIGGYLGLDQWPEGIAKNIKVLIDREDGN